jgi:hypothetical protein
LQQMILNPKMAYAVKHARFPISVLFCVFILVLQSLYTNLGTIPFFAKPET